MAKAKVDKTLAALEKVEDYQTEMRADFIILAERIWTLVNTVEDLKKELHELRSVAPAKPVSYVVAFKTKRFGDRVFRVPAEDFNRTPAHTWVSYEASK